jgi:hypothetical protein
MGSDFGERDETRYKTKYSENFSEITRRKKYKVIRNGRKHVTDSGPSKGRKTFGARFGSSYSEGLSTKWDLRRI